MFTMSKEQCHNSVFQILKPVSHHKYLYGQLVDIADYTKLKKKKSNIGVVPSEKFLY